jgi:beta-galactosidase
MRWSAPWRPKPGLELTDLPDGVRLRRRGGLTFAFNFAPEAQLAPAPKGVTFVLGGRDMPAGGISAWRSLF